MSAADVVEGRLSKGARVRLEGRVTQLLPVFRMGELTYERFLLEDDTGRVTVIAPASEVLLLPGDEVRVEGRVRPCPYAPSMNCLETRAEEVELLGWRWADPTHREGLLTRGAFNVKILLHMTSLDEEVIRGVMETELDPMRIREAFERRLSSGGGFQDLLATLSAMTMYSIFLRDLAAAGSTRLSVALLEGLPLPEEVRASLSMLSDMLNTLVSREGLAPYISPPRELRGIVESYPTFKESDLDALPRLRDLARRLAEGMASGERVHVILEFSERDELEEVRRMVEIVAGVSQARLLMVLAPSLAEDMAEVMSDLRDLATSRPGERLLVYLEAPELLVPNDRMLEMMSVQRELISAISNFKRVALRMLRDLMERASIVAVTSSLAMVDTEALAGVKQLPLRAAAIPGGMDYSL